jgi:hypothetical protein
VFTLQIKEYTFGGILFLFFPLSLAILVNMSVGRLNHDLRPEMMGDDKMSCIVFSPCQCSGPRPA